jgi:hypothetical protein
MFKVDDTFPESRKVDKLGEKYPKLYSKCIALWLFVGCYSARNRTDGVVSLVRIRSLNPFLGINSRHINALIDVGLWVKTDDVIEMKNWDTYNETKSQKDERLRVDRERKRRKRGEGKLGSVPQGVPADVQTDSERTSERNPGIGIGNGFKDKGNSNSPKEWMQIAKMYTEITGSVQDTYSQEKPAEALLGACKRVDDANYLKVARAALEGFWADEWVKERRLGLKYLSEHIDRFVRKPAPKKKKRLSSWEEQQLRDAKKIDLPQALRKLEEAKERGDEKEIKRRMDSVEHYQFSIAQWEERL